MTPAARVQAAIGLLDEVLQGTAAEQALTRWARANRYAGSKDRAAVRDHVFDALRCRRSFAALGGALTGRGLMLGALRASGQEVAALFDGSTYGPVPVSEGEGGRPPAPGDEALDIPDWLWPEFERSLGRDTATVAGHLQHRAPICLRVNTRKTTRAEVIAALSADGIAAHPSQEVPTAVYVAEGARRLRTTNAFRSGAFEFQDAASQAVVQALPLQARQRVLDYCAGGGGKSLAMAAQADVDVTAHDKDPARMRDLPTRAARAGADIAITRRQDLTMAAPFDLIMCDVPCSGSGSWRRAPEARWTLTAERLAALHEAQLEILERCKAMLAPGGTLAYVTCSVLTCENEDIISTFLARYPEFSCQMQRRWAVSTQGDGFFLALLTR